MLACRERGKTLISRRNLLATGSLGAVRIAPIATALLVASKIASTTSALVAAKEAGIELAGHVIET